MVSKIWLINVMLVACALILGVNAHHVWTDKGRPLPRVRGDAQDAALPGQKPADRPKKLARSAYKVVVEKNLFSPEREEFVPEVPEEAAEPEASPVKISGRKVVLYGVILMDDYQKALINNPTRKGDEPPNRWVAVGDTVGNLKVAAIEKESLLLNDGGKKYEVLLYDRKKQRSGGPSAGSGQSAPQVISTESSRKKVEKQGKAAEKSADSGEYKVVKTPFGDVRVKKK
ncbi:hypothetical protein DENIS_1146 [Desulfonema ishimotonii]|uniref:Type II secretion system protein GspC N-terminal domain-containing protein n=1 Tax=Desulfonema ishimotonii TaxID=45657 RepID=A0A401FTA5_9BACT|nr:hypothetical protein [Desulfonema ishimotonii]GBC60195.1 hypothetical protein DENIS_1146 [Desulfonema ishimotonii]